MDDKIIFSLNPEQIPSFPAITEIFTSTKQLEETKINLNDEFINGFFGPPPAGLSFWLVLIVITIVVFNILIIPIWIIVFWWLPRRNRLNIPRNGTAKEWFNYAERNLKYNNHSVIREAYITTLKLDPNYSIARLRYGQYEANLAIQYKPAITGDPRGLPTNFNAQDAYDRLINSLKTINTDRAIIHPFKKSRIEPIFAITGVLAFDLKKYEQARKWLEKSFNVFEFYNSKSGLEKNLELRLNLAQCYINANYNLKAIEQILYTIKISSLAKKHSHEAQGWEFLGELFYVTIKYQAAEICFLHAVNLDSRRWISSRHLYSIYNKSKEIKRAEKYLKIYTHMQKRLKPL